MKPGYVFGSVMCVWFLSVGCVPVEDEHQQDIDGYVGTWNWEDGSSGTITCPGDSTNFGASGNSSFTEGTDSDLVFLDSNCNIEFDVDGNTASLTESQSCEGSEGTLTWSTWTFERNFDRLTAEASGTFESDQGVECSVSLNGSLERVGS